MNINGNYLVLIPPPPPPNIFGNSEVLLELDIVFVNCSSFCTLICFSDVNMFVQV